MITLSNTSSSSLLPAALSTVGVETTVGTEVIRDFGKRKSVNTSMFGKFHGRDSRPVLQNISNPVISQAKSKKPRHSGTEIVPSLDASKVPMPSNALGGAADELSADALPSSGGDDGRSSSDEDDNEDDDDVNRLLFGNNIFDGMQEDDAPIAETLSDQVEGSTAIVSGSAGPSITQEVPLPAQEAPLPDKLNQQPELEDPPA